MLSYIAIIIFIFIIAKYIEKNRIRMLQIALRDVHEGDFLEGGDMILWDGKEQWKPSVFLISLLAFILFLIYLWQPIYSSIIVETYIVISCSILFLLGLSYHFFVHLRLRANKVLIANKKGLEKVLVWNGKIRKRLNIPWNEVKEFWVSEVSTTSSFGEYSGIVVEKKDVRIAIPDSYINAGMLCRWISDNFSMEVFSQYTYHQLTRTGNMGTQAFLNELKTPP